LTKPKARLIVPFWGLSYTRKVLDLTLPALVSPNNLPALAEDFDVELCLVTERALFGHIRESVVYRRCLEFCEVIFEPIDDILTGVAGDYGPVLTFALFKGFVGLRERMLDYYLLFLCADFIVADGSYRTIGRLMLEGKRVIHCPSFRANEDGVLPAIMERVDRERGVLAVSCREMAGLALEHRHMTVKARTVNQKLFHQWRMDQFYWYVDEHTLVGYQWPIAVAALKPEVVVEKPVLMFDYGFIPEICPSGEYHFIPESDQAFMLEIQRRLAGEDMIRLGWISDEDMVKDLNLWTTREHRICGRRPHVFHARDIPPETERVIKTSGVYMDSLISRLAPPNPHCGHPLFKNWWNTVCRRMETTAAETGSPTVVTETGASASSTTPAASFSRALARHAASTLAWTGRNIVAPLYRALFGRRPFMRMCHPYWIDTHRIAERLAELSKDGKVLNVASRESFFAPILPTPVAIDALAFPEEMEALGLTPRSVDLCYFEVKREHLRNFKTYYDRVRPYVRDGGHIFLFVSRDPDETLLIGDPEFMNDSFPDVDISFVTFFGTASTRRLLRIVRRCQGAMFSHPVLRNACYGLLLFALALPAYLANRRASSTDDPTLHSNTWTSILFEFQVVREQRIDAEGRRESV